MADITIKQDQLPADYFDRLAAGIADSRSSTVLSGGGKPFLRLLKSGEWVYGPENIDVQEGSKWLANTTTLAHGYCCWVDSELRGEIMVSMIEPKPARPPAIDNVAFAEQRAFELKCMDGEDAGAEVLYKTASDGGTRAIDALLALIQPRLTQRTPYIFPVLNLSFSHYQHAKYGRIYKPVLDVVGWANVNAQLEGWNKATAAGNGAKAAVDPIPEPAPAPAPSKSRRPPLGAVAPATEAPAEAAPHTGQRRRPVAK